MIAFLIYLSLAKGIWPLNLVFLNFEGIQQVLNSDFLKFRILEILNFHPRNCCAFIVHLLYQIKAQ